MHSLAQKVHFVPVGASISVIAFGLWSQHRLALLFIEVRQFEL
jgi:hypothetical protein